MKDNNIVSPCISVCKTDPISGFCYGCGRSDEDKAVWKNPETTNEWKLENDRLFIHLLVIVHHSAFEK